MPLDAETFDYLRGECDKEKSRETRRFNQMLEQKLGTQRHLLVGSEQEKAQKRQAIEKNFWLKHKPELDKLHKNYEARYYGDYGGSEAAARQLMNEEARNALKHQFDTAMNDNQQKQAQNQNEQTAKLQKEEVQKKKKDKEKQEQQQREQQKQNQLEDEKKRRTEAIRQKRLNQQFDRKR